MIFAGQQGLLGADWNLLGYFSLPVRLDNGASAVFDVGGMGIGFQIVGQPFDGGGVINGSGNEHLDDMLGWAGEIVEDEERQTEQGTPFYKTRDPVSGPKKEAVERVLPGIHPAGAFVVFPQFQILAVPATEAFAFFDLADDGLFVETFFDILIRENMAISLVLDGLFSGIEDLRLFLIVGLVFWFG